MTPHIEVLASGRSFFAEDLKPKMRVQLYMAEHFRTRYRSLKTVSTAANAFRSRSLGRIGHRSGAGARSFLHIYSYIQPRKEDRVTDSGKDLLLNGHVYYSGCLSGQTRRRRNTRGRKSGGCLPISLSLFSLLGHKRS